MNLINLEAMARTSDCVRAGGGAVMTQLSAYRNSYDTSDKDVSFGAVASRIRTGARGLDEKTRMCHLLAATDTDAYKAYKEKELLAVTFAGTFPRGQRKAAQLAVHSSRVVLDIDHLCEPDIPGLLSELAQLQQVNLAFISPSGKGIKVVVPVSPTPKNDAEHKTAWAACVDFFEALADEYGFQIDASGKDCSRLCYLAHDPLSIVHAEISPIAWDPEDVYLHTSDLEDYAHTDADTSSLRAFLKSQDVKILGRRARGGFFVECLNRSEHTGGLQGRTDSFIRLSENGLIYHCSHSHCADMKSGWFFEQRGLQRDPFRKAPKRYSVNTAYAHKTGDLDTERTENTSVLVKWLQKTEAKKGKHLLVLGSAAGTGKTTAAITTAARLLYISKTVEEADQVFQTLSDREDDVHRHRSRMFNRDHENWNTLPLGLTEKDRPCISPERCDTYAERGHPTHEVCLRCPRFSDCKKDGYLSQKHLEKNAMKVVYSWDEVVACDSKHSDRVKRICSKDDILILDEVNPANLTQSRKLTREMLFDLTERFRDPNTVSEFKTLKGLLDLLSTAEDEKAFFDGLTAQIQAIEDIEAFDEKVEKFPVGHFFSEAPENVEWAFQVSLDYRGKEVTVPVVDYETGIDTPVFKADREIMPSGWDVVFLPLSVLIKVGLVPLDDPPVRFRSLFSDIKTFLAENKNNEQCPCFFDPKAQTFDFHLKPTLNHRRVIFNTASDPDNLIGEAYRGSGIEITRHTGTPPVWKSSLVFQLSTGNYLPRHSLISREGEALALKPRAQEMVDRFIVPSIEAGLKTLVVAPKAFQEIQTVGSLSCELINHHHAEGRNDYQDYDVAFIFHYEPNHHELVGIAKRLYRNVEQPLDFTRKRQTVAVNGVTLKKNVYIDTRVQSVYNRECRQRLMQAAMRLRPNIHEQKIIVFLTAEPVDIPVTPVAFSLSDGNRFDGNWATFVQQREQREKTSVAELVDAGVSKSTAYRKTQSRRTLTKSAQKKQAFVWYDEKVSLTEIARRLSEGLPAPIHRTTVKRWVETRKF